MTGRMVSVQVHHKRPTPEPVGADSKQLSIARQEAICVTFTVLLALLGAGLGVWFAATGKVP